MEETINKISDREIEVVSTREERNSYYKNELLAQKARIEALLDLFK